MDIAPSRMYNYDETNLTNDPGKEVVLVRRGALKRIETYVERLKFSPKKVKIFPISPPYPKTRCSASVT